jgi:hypothetical protein
VSNNLNAAQFAYYQQNVKHLLMAKEKNKPEGGKKYLKRFYFFRSTSLQSYRPGFSPPPASKCITIAVLFSFIALIVSGAVSIFFFGFLLLCNHTKWIAILSTRTSRLALGVNKKLRGCKLVADFPLVPGTKRKIVKTYSVKQNLCSRSCLCTDGWLCNILKPSHCEHSFYFFFVFFIIARMKRSEQAKTERSKKNRTFPVLALLYVY